MFEIDNSNHIIRPKNSFLDFNAIAKGYAVDLISVFLENNDIKNSLEELGLHCEDMHVLGVFKADKLREK